MCLDVLEVNHAGQDRAGEGGRERGGLFLSKSVTKTGFGAVISQPPFSCNINSLACFYENYSKCNKVFFFFLINC